MQNAEFTSMGASDQPLHLWQWPIPGVVQFAAERQIVGHRCIVVHVSLDSLKSTSILTSDCEGPTFKAMFMLPDVGAWHKCAAMTEHAGLPFRSVA